MQVRARSAIVRMVGSGLTCAVVAVDEQSNGFKGGCPRVDNWSSLGQDNACLI